MSDVSFEEHKQEASDKTTLSLQCGAVSVGSLGSGSRGVNDTVLAQKGPKLLHFE